MLLALLIILGTRELHRQKGNVSSPRSASFRCQMVGTALCLTPPRCTAGTCWRMLWLWLWCRLQWALLQQHTSGGAGDLSPGASALSLLLAITRLCSSMCRLFWHLWILRIQRQDLKAYVLERFQNPKINDTCHYKMTCWSSHSHIWMSMPHQSTWCWKDFLLFLVIPLLCIPQVPLWETS